jgi:hypothetical protein
VSIGNNQVEEDKMGVACSTNGGEEERVYLVGGKARGKEATGRPRSRWVDNIRKDVGEVGWGDVVWLRIRAGGELS